MDQNKKKKVSIAVSLYDKKNIDTFLNHLLPLQFTDGNIKIFKKYINYIKNKNSVDPSNDVLQNFFKKIFLPHNLCYQFEANVGFEFLKKYSHLFHKDFFFNLKKNNKNISSNV